MIPYVVGSSFGVEGEALQKKGFDILRPFCTAEKLGCIHTSLGGVEANKLALRNGTL